MRRGVGVCLRTLTEVLPKAGLLEATKRRGHVSLVVGVDEDGSGLQPLAHVQGFVDVSCEHTGGKAKLCVIRSAQHAINVTEEGKGQIWRIGEKAVLCCLPCANQGVIVWDPKMYTVHTLNLNLLTGWNI